MSRRDRVRLAQLDHTRVRMAMIAEMLREISTRHDQHAHLVGKIARASRGALTEAATLSLGLRLFGEPSWPERG